MPRLAFPKGWLKDRGLVVSASAHAALLGLTLVAFSRTPPYEDATETIPVEMISDSAFSQVIKGEKSAKVVKPTPKVDKIADLAETKPLPPVAEAKKDVPLPPPPLKRLPDPGEDEKPEPVKEQPKTAALPPSRPTPEPPKETPAPPQRPQEVKAVEEKPSPDDAEVVRPKPVERPKDLAKTEPKPDPKPTPPFPPKPQLKIDEVAKLLEKSKPDPTPKPVAKPKSGEDETEPKQSLDLTAISKLLDHDRPQRKIATGAQLQQVAAVGAATANATRMAPSMWDSLAGIIQEQYQRCWSQSGRSLELNYWPVVRVQLGVDGRLSASPTLMNPAGDADRRALGEAAIRAVRMCDPLRIPAQFASFYSEWKSMRVNMRTDN